MRDELRAAAEERTMLQGQCLRRPMAPAIPEVTVEQHSGGMTDSCSDAMTHTFAIPHLRDPSVRGLQIKLTERPDTGFPVTFCLSEQRSSAGRAPAAIFGSN